MTFEVRVIDMTNVWVDPNVIAEPPAGKTIYAAPADFEKADEVVEPIELASSEAEGKTGCPFTTATVWPRWSSNAREGGERIRRKGF